MSAKKAVRMSIFTIDEEDESNDNEWSYKVCFVLEIITYIL
jgi:hypothetical protein